tara:strand:- start:37 stop:681 length:645 start_codon:yes stop_codon:yes gene_type:complete
MINKLKKIIFIILIFYSNTLLGQEQFNFDVTEIEIKENGNKFFGLKRGTITSDDGIEIEADTFVYDKILNILDAKGNVKVIDELNDYTIFSNKITYFKNDEIIFTKGNSKAINKNIVIFADEFRFFKKTNILIAKKKVKVDDSDEDVVIFAEELTYNKNEEVLFSKGYTEANIQDKYDFYSSNVFYNKKKIELSSESKTQIVDDKFTIYELDKF